LFHESKKPREERTDYAWLHCLQADSLPVLRKKLKTPSVKQRLREIEAKWPNLAKKVKGIRERVYEGRSMFFIPASHFAESLYAILVPFGRRVGCNATSP
jgi:hypothetical protein